jgi:SAM-dependent methyltransferase
MQVVPLHSSYAAVFASALRGDACEVLGLDDRPHVLPIADWTRPVDAGDLALLSHCVGETLDVGCGPGRMTRALAERGHAVLGIDVVPEAIRMTRERGGVAIVRDVFQSVPGEGRWATALLADGNIGIGGDPRALLGRVRALLAPGGRVVVDLAEPGAGVRTLSVRLQTRMLRSRPFAWSVVGADAIGVLAIGAGLSVLGLHTYGDRWFAVLEKGAR